MKPMTKDEISKHGDKPAWFIKKSTPDKVFRSGESGSGRLLYGQNYWYFTNYWHAYAYLRKHNR